MVCAVGEEGIFEDDEYLEDGEGKPICKDCVNEMSAEEVLDLVGEKFMKAS